MLTTGHLFAGAGGGLLADLILGHKPAFAVEWDANCCATLRARAADGWFPGLHVHEGDVRMFNPSDWAGRVDSLHAGFPCQDISAAGTGRGIDGERSGLVSEVFRAIDAIRPRFVFLENSPRIRTKGRDRVIAELVARGYAWRDGVLGAADVGAPHDRDRWWCLAANADGLRKLEQEGRKPDFRGRTDNRAEETPDADCTGCTDGGGISTDAGENGNLRRSASVEHDEASFGGGPSWFAIEPDVGDLVYGLADELVPGAVKALGNGQVPLQAAAAYALLGGLVGP